jgi:hypothetical protein
MMNIPNKKILEGYGLVIAPRLSHHQLTAEGRKFLLRLMTEGKAKQAQSLGY